jgi:formylglycine-generating enzyme required for sulfatase activity
VEFIDRSLLLLLALGLLLVLPACDEAVVDDVACDRDVDFQKFATVQGMVLARLCPGTFSMGCTASQELDGHCEPDEFPVHDVTLSRGLWVGTTEVTQGQWQGVMGNNPSHFSDCGADCPVESVNWWESLAFANAVSAAEGLAECYTLSDCTGTAGDDMDCKSSVVNTDSGSQYDCEGYRIPHEAEWEYAGRAGTDLIFAGSNNHDDVAWHNSNSGGITHPVATKQPNPWDLYDISGNVWEWTRDRMNDRYESGPATDPEGSLSGSGRVLRGGGVLHGHFWDLRIANRSGSGRIGEGGPVGREHWVGFRLVRTVH